MSCVRGSISHQATTDLVIQLQIFHLNKAGTNLTIYLMNIELSWFEEMSERPLEDEGYEPALNARRKGEVYRWEAWEPSRVP
jgi:hypothetical protein